MTKYKKDGMNSFGVVVLILGKRCNLRCRLCSQEKDRKQCPDGLAFSRECETWLRDSAKALWEKSAGRSKLKIVLWGGEPLLYLDRMQEVVEKLKDVPIEWHTTTNGLLLPAAADFINSVPDFIVALSNDGRRTGEVKLINSIELPEVVDAYKKLKHPNKRIMLTLHALSQDLLAEWGYVIGKVGETFINATTPLRPSDATPALLVDFDYEQFAKTYSKIIAIANAVKFAQERGIEEKHGTVAWNCKNYLDMLVGQIAAQTQFPSCALNCRQMYARIAVDLAGNVYPCHNRGGALGHISDGAAALRARFLSKGNVPYKHQECRECWALPLCGGQCPCVEPSPLKEKVCKLLREIIFNNDVLLRYAGAQEFYNSLKECLPSD
jgi:uncharacterized protein